MQQAFAHGKINPLPDELLYVLLCSAETMDNPRLYSFVFLPQGDDFIMAAYIMKNHGLLQGFRKFDLPPKEFDLSLKSRLVHFVQACLSESNDLWQLQFLFKSLQCFF